MYSPKIREDLIPRVYRAAKAAAISMTTWVNQAVEKSLPEALLNHNHNTKERMIAMSATQTERSNDRLENTFVIAKSEHGYRVCSPLTPAKQYVVSGLPENPQCTCADFMNPDAPPDWQCPHILAVLEQVNGADRSKTASPPVPADHGSSEPPASTGKNGKKSPGGRNGKGAVMLLKRSVSPDGRIDSLSVEFTLPVGQVTSEEIKAQAGRFLSLQSQIASAFLKTTAPRNSRINGKGNGSSNRNGDTVPQNAVPGQLLAVASMNTRRGPKLTINVMVNGQVLKFFGSKKELAEAVTDAGFASVADHLSDGMTLNLPCRVVTVQNGKYTNVDRVYPAQAGGNGSA
jgi:hypothetical protein